MKAINSTEKRLANEVFEKIPTVDRNAVQEMLKSELADLNKKIIVLDDDPTGVQTVHDISVYTDWSVDSIEKGFAEDNAMFFILTNSRGFTAAETEKAHKEIAENASEVAKRHGKEFIVISPPYA